MEEEWLFFSMKDYDAVYRIFASFGLIVIGVDFRSSLQCPFPAGLHDCFSAVMWTAEHADELQIDKEKLIVGGESGGGNLTAATCLFAKEKKYFRHKRSILKLSLYISIRPPFVHLLQGLLVSSQYTQTPVSYLHTSRTIQQSPRVALNRASGPTPRAPPDSSGDE